MSITDSEPPIDDDLPRDQQKRKNLLLVRSLVERTSRLELDWFPVDKDELYIYGEYTCALGTTIDTETVGEVGIQILEKEADHPDARGYYESELQLVFSTSVGKRGVWATPSHDPQIFRELITLIQTALEPIDPKRVKRETERLRRIEKNREIIDRGIDEIINSNRLIS